MAVGWARAAAAGAAFSITIGGALASRWRATWGVVAEEATAVLPGDGVVGDAMAVDTRGITIDAPPEKVWPWLVQMGYGRAGWYSYDRLDMDRPSADAIVPEWQSLAVGDRLPTDPNGGFEVRSVEPERSLVVAADGTMFAGANGTRELDVAAAPGLAASGRFLETAMPADFAASWAFVLRPIDGGRTRFIERFRIRLGRQTAVTRLLAPAMGFGVFVMLRKQMLGIRDRAERLAREAPSEHWLVTMATNGRAEIVPEVARASS